MPQVTPAPGDIFEPRFKSIEGRYHVKVTCYEDGVVTFSTLTHGIPVGVHTNYLHTFLHRFELVSTDNVVCIDAYRNSKQTKSHKRLTL